MTELEIITEAATLLRSTGRTSVEYVTAELAPFSDQFRPDLVLFPAAVPSAALFIEFRRTSGAHRVSVEEMVHRLGPRKDFVASDLSDATILYAFASDQKLPADYIVQLRRHGIEFLGPITTGQDLAQHVCQWLQRISSHTSQVGGLSKS